MKKILLIMLVVMFSVVSAQASLTEWTDGFESGLGNWTVSGGVQRTAAWAYEGTHTAYTLAENGKYMYRSISEGADVDEVFTVEFAIHPGASSSTTGKQNFFLSQDADWNPAIALAGVQVSSFNGGSSITTYEGSVSTNLTDNTWYVVKLVIKPDFVNGGTYDWYLDGALQEAAVGFNTLGPTGKTRYMVSSHSYTDNSFYVDMDAVSVSAIPEPGTLALLIAGSSLFVKRKRK